MSWSAGCCRLQYFARGVQAYIKQLRLALQGATPDSLKTEEVKCLSCLNPSSAADVDLFSVNNGNARTERVEAISWSQLTCQVLAWICFFGEQGHNVLVCIWVFGNFFTTVVRWFPPIVKCRPTVLLTQ